MAPPRRLNLKWGLALLVLWLVATSVSVALHLPPWAPKVALALCGAAWAIHVAQVALANRGR